MDIKQLKAAVQLAKLRVGSDPSDANKAKLEHAQNEYDNALNPEKKTEDEPNPNKQPETPKSATKAAAPAKPKTEPLERQPLENHPLKTTRTVPEEPQEPQKPEPQPDAQPKPKPTEAK